MTELSLFPDSDFETDLPVSFRQEDTIMAFFSKSATERERFIRQKIASHKGTVLHLHPKNVKRVPYADGVLLASYEDITKTDVWLRINNLIADDTLLVLENPSRYPKITSTKVKFLRRLSMRLRGERIITDITPFTESIEYLYTPYSYLGREILGYSHWYAFRENYQEMTDDGRIVHGLDYDVLAERAAPVSEIDYKTFMVDDYEMVRVDETQAEFDRYYAKKEELFARYEGEEGLRMADDGPPQKIVTRLADCCHHFESRYQTMVRTVKQLKQQQQPGQRVVVVYNLQSYATDGVQALKAAGIGKGCITTSYQVAAERIDWSDVGAVVFAEAPIVNSYYRLDIEAALAPTCKVRFLRGMTGVDAYLNEQIGNEIGQIDEFTRHLWAACRKRRALGSI